VAIADDPCEAAFGCEIPPGPRKYYRARYYDPKIGRFLSEDPVWDADSLYAYASNNPTDLTDPTGMMVLSAYDTLKVIDRHNYSGQPRTLILCLIYRESTFDTMAHNLGTDARGLMQVRAAAAKDEGMDFSLMFDPELNVATGTSYLARLIRRKHGNARAGLAAYGEGPHYADAIINCSCCLQASMANTNPFSSARNPQHCLNEAKK